MYTLDASWDWSQINTFLHYWISDRTAQSVVSDANARGADFTMQSGTLCMNTIKYIQ